jgi:hypothetical protein
VEVVAVVAIVDGGAPRGCALEQVDSTPAPADTATDRCMSVPDGDYDGCSMSSITS